MKTLNLEVFFLFKQFKKFLKDFIYDAEERSQNYKEEKDRSLQVNQENIERYENSNPLFRAGQSNRVWGELFKVIDSSDVIVQVINIIY